MWKPRLGDMYFYADIANDTIDNKINDGDDFDNKIINIGNAFFKSKTAKKALEHMKESLNNFRSNITDWEEVEGPDAE